MCRLMPADKFPKPVRTVAWRESDVAILIDSRPTSS